MIDIFFELEGGGWITVRVDRRRIVDVVPCGYVDLSAVCVDIGKLGQRELLIEVITDVVAVCRWWRCVVVSIDSEEIDDLMDGG